MDINNTYMIYKRQKILLALLESFGGSLKNTDLQKYLFLLTRLQKDKCYEFVPYKFGCFSFQVYDDKRQLINKGLLKDSLHCVLENGKTNYSNLLTFKDNAEIWQIKKQFHQLKGKKLIKYVYLTYPYYAIKSSIAKQILTKTEFQHVEANIPINNETVLYTIGYEGKSLEEYLNILIKQDIRILCDVRKNAYSMKYGFSKKTLKNSVETVGMEYLHFSELGIVSDDRKNLTCQNDYNTLFETYEKTVLKSENLAIQQLFSHLKNKKRIALTCFEKSPEMCHRTRVAHAILRLSEDKIKLKEL